jgi:hypothetical protein
MYSATIRVIVFIVISVLDVDPQIKSFNHLMQRKEVAEATVEIMHVVTEQLEALAERKFVVARKRAVRRRKLVKGGIEDGEAAEAEGEEGEEVRAFFTRTWNITILTRF